MVLFTVEHENIYMVLFLLLFLPAPRLSCSSHVHWASTRPTLHITSVEGGDCT